MKVMVMRGRSRCLRTYAELRAVVRPQSLLEEENVKCEDGELLVCARLRHVSGSRSGCRESTVQ